MSKLLPDESLQMLAFTKAQYPPVPRTKREWKLVVLIFLSCLLLLMCLLNPLHRKSLGTAQNSTVLYSDRDAQGQISGTSFKVFNTAESSDLKINTKMQRKLTIIVSWLHDDVPPYLRHFLYSAQLNADSIDLLFINRIIASDRKCIDFKKHGIDVSWGGNIKIVCMGLDEWKQRLASFLCSYEHGWNCDRRQRSAVWKELRYRTDPRSSQWRPLAGYVYKDLIPDPNSQFWAWADLDMVLGDLRYFPYEFLSHLSLLTVHHGNAVGGFMAGQFTAFNFNDEKLASAWKSFPTLRTAEHFTRKLAGNHQQSIEEKEWSFRYLNTEVGDNSFAGNELAFAILPDLQGDDNFGDETFDVYHERAFLISGRDVLLVNRSMSRDHLMDFLTDERLRPSPLSSEGREKTKQESQLIQWLNDQQQGVANLDSSKFQVDTVRWSRGADSCPDSYWIPSKHRLCVPPILRKDISDETDRYTLLRLKDQKQGNVFRISQAQPTGFENGRRLMKHFLRSKKLSWNIFPDFEIDSGKSMLLTDSSIEVWPNADIKKTIYAKRKG